MHEYMLGKKKGYVKTTICLVGFAPSFYDEIICISGEHQVEDYTKEGEEAEEMTEEEWSRRVAELNALQVGV